MINGQHLKSVPFSSLQFRNCYKAYPFNSPNSTSYLMLHNQQANPQLYSQKNINFICPVISSQTDDCCYIAMQGESLHEYVLSKKNDASNCIMTEEQIWSLIICMCEAFCILKQFDNADKLTHLKQYCIRRIEEKRLFKLIFHPSMVSQLDTAKSGLCQWHELYMSPQELTNKFVPEKSIVFSFGVLLLNLCSNLDNGRTIYKHDKFQVDVDIIKQKILIARQYYGYSKLLCNFIQQCLVFKQDQRFDFFELKQFLQRKLDRQYSKQSQLLSQIKDLEKGKNKGFAYQIWLPPNYKARETFKYHNLVKPNLHRTKSQKNTQMIINNEELTPQKNILPNSLAGPIDQQSKQKKSKSIKKKTSLKKFEVPKIKKQNMGQSPKQQIQQSPRAPIKHQANLLQNIQYRGTFGARNILLSSYEIQKNQNTAKRVKKVKQDSESEYQQQVNQKNEQSTQKKTQNTKSVQTDKKVTSKYNIPSLSLQKIQYSGQNPLKLQITCNNGVHDVREHFCNMEQAQTPKGFGKFSFNKDLQQQNMGSPRRIQQSTAQYTQSNSSPPQKSQFKQRQIPTLINKMGTLLLQYCLKPIEQLISTIGKVGIWIQGDLYYGEIVNGRRHGLALEIFANGQYYFGFFKEDLFSGEGFYYWNSRQYFFGQFSLGQKIWGRLQGEVQYQGQFMNNKRHGKGTCWYSTGEIYSGEWSKGKRHGYGVVIDPQGTKFVGNWTKGKRKGEGCLQTDGMRIAGNWNDEVIEGESLIEYSNGDVFRGKTGKILQKIEGQYISKTGRIFKGQFQNDQPKKGQLVYSNGDKYVGQLKNMKRNGYGEYYYTSGEVYKGLWENNIKKQ